MVTQEQLTRIMELRANGRSHEEIAKEIGIPRSTVAYQLRLLKKIPVPKQTKKGIVWTHFPKDIPPNEVAREIVNAFNKNKKDIDSEIFGKGGSNKERTKFDSNFVLGVISSDLKDIPGMIIEEKDQNGKTIPISIPILYGHCGVEEKTYQPDAWHENQGVLVEIEGALKITQNKVHIYDLFKACLIHNVEHFVIAAAKTWEGNAKNPYKPYDTIVTEFTAIYESRRFKLPIKSITVIGY